MKKLGYAILVIVIIIIIILSLILVMRNRNKYEFKGTDVSDTYISIDDQIYKVENLEYYYTISRITNRFCDYILKGNAKAVYYMLKPDYIEKNNITISDVLQKINIRGEYFKVNEIYIKDDLLSPIYFVNAKTSEGKVFFIVFIDGEREKKTFAIEPISEENYKQYIEGREQVFKQHEIIENEFNIFNLSYLSQEERVIKYFEDYIDNALYYVSDAYYLLKKEYKEARFTDLNDFKSYIEDKRDMYLSYRYENEKKISDFSNTYEYLDYINSLKTLELDSYTETKEDGYTKYVIKDNFDNYYIFYVTSMMQYTVILDTYTIDIPEFTDRYNKANDQEKVILNINKFNLAINDGNYKYAYSVLADSFKEKNFPTLASFENYMKSNFFEKSKFEYASFGNEAGGTYYTYKVNITEQGGSSSKTIQKTFIMQLGDRHRFQDVI